MVNINDGISMIKFRLSNHNLKIEKADIIILKKNNSFCLFCQTRAEDEPHFLIKCPTYDPTNTFGRPKFTSSPG